MPVADLVAEQLARLQLEPFREPMNVDQGDIAFAALDGSDIGAVEIARERQRFLSQPLRLAELPEARSEALFDPPRIHARLSATCGL